MTRLVATLVLILSAFSGAGAQQPDSIATRLLNQAYAFRRANQPDSAARLFAGALARDSCNARIARELGFAQLAAGDTLGARDTFRHIVHIVSPPGTRDDQAQLGYLDLAISDLPGAITAFEGATRAAPNDGPLHLQLAYAYESAKNHVAALREFERAALVGNAAVRRQARTSMLILAGRWYARPGTVLTDWYEASSYGTRFNDFIGAGNAHLAVALDPATRAQMYITGRLIRDSRTLGGVQPVIFSDNYIAAAIGIRARPLPIDLTVYAEAGPTSSFTTGGRSGLDSRAGLTYGSAWTSSDTRWFGESYADASYYSRYSDAIGYAQFRQLHPIPAAASWLDAYVREGLTADSRGIGYNNLAEGAAGFRAHGGPHAIAALYLEYVQGIYTRSSIDGRRSFGEVRATFVASGLATFLPR